LADGIQTTDRAVVEYCRRNAIEFEWKGDRLKNTLVAVVAKHPQTGEMVWFNHATFPLPTLEPTMREALLEELKKISQQHLLWRWLFD